MKFVYCFVLLSVLLPTRSSLALAINPVKQYSFATSTSMNHGTFLNRRGGSQAISTASDEESTTKLFSSTLSTDVNEKRPLKVLFLSSDTGGGHRASAEALAAQFQIQFPGSTYELADLWSDHGVLPYRTLVETYKHLSAHPLQWRLFYHLSNTKINEVCANFHSRITCGGKIKKRIQEFDPDVVISVHPTMNHTPLKAVRTLSKELDKHIPFFTVVTDLGSGHCMWFERKVNKLYVASKRLYKLARRRGGTPKDRISMVGLPIRHDFSVQADKLGDRTSEEGKAYQTSVRKELNINPDKQMVLVMGGGEGVGSLSEIVDQLYIKLTQQGVDATVCVVCGRNEKLKEKLAEKDWKSLFEEAMEKEKSGKGKKLSKRRRLLNFFKSRVRRNKKIDDAIERIENKESTNGKLGSVDIVPLGFMTNMPEYMVAADVLVSKAGPGTIAEAAAVGLPIMLTSFLPGQEAGNVDVVLESGFGDYCSDPEEIGQEVGYWLRDPALMKTMSDAAKEAGHPCAADEIVHDIGVQTVSWMSLNEK